MNRIRQTTGTHPYDDDVVIESVIVELKLELNWEILVSKLVNLVLKLSKLPGGL
jgi:hypothetical protein